MKMHDLAKALRKKQIEMGLNPPDLVNKLSDEAIIECYTTDAKTDKPLLSPEEVDSLVADAATMDEFVRIIDDILTASRRAERIAEEGMRIWQEGLDREEKE